MRLDDFNVSSIKTAIKSELSASVLNVLNYRNRRPYEHALSMAILVKEMGDRQV